MRVSQSLVQAGPRGGVGLDDASPSNAGFAVPSGLLFCGANLAATRLPHPHLRCGFCFVETRSLVGRAVLCPPRFGAQRSARLTYSFVAAPVRARKIRFKPIGWASASGSAAQWTARPTLLSASASRPLNVAALVRARTVGIPAREARSARPTPGAQWTARPTLLSTPLV